MSCVFLQYLGSTRVTQTHGPGSTDDAVKKIVNDVSSNHFSTHFLSLTFKFTSMSLMNFVETVTSTFCSLCPRSFACIES